MRRRVLISLLGAVLAAVAYFVFVAGSDEERIRRTVEELAQAVEVDSGDTNVLTRTLRVRSRLARLVEEDVHIRVEELPGGTLRGRDALTEYIGQLPSMYETIGVTLRAFDVRLDPGGVLARVTVRAWIRGVDRRGEERTVDLLLRKDEGRWRVSTLNVAAPSGP